MGRKRTTKQKICKAVILTAIIDFVGIGVLMAIYFGMGHYNIDYSITKVHINTASTSKSIWAYSQEAAMKPIQ